MTPNQPVAPREVTETQGALNAYRAHVGDQSFLCERNALHEALQATMKRMGKTTIDLDVAHAMAAAYGTDENWGLLALVCLEHLSGEAALDDLRRWQAPSVGTTTQRARRRH